MLKRLSISFALAVGMSVISAAQQIGPNINMATGSDIYLQRQNELAVGISSVNPDHQIAFWNDWRTIDNPNDTGAGTSPQTIFVRLFHLPKKPDLKSHRPTDMAAAEGWTAVGMSNNGGWNWSSGLVPGFPGDKSQEGAVLRANDYDAMADPWVSCDPSNCHVVTIAFTRGGGSALVYFRYTDQNKSETGHNWKMTIPPTILRTGNNSLPGTFNDKPVIIAGANGQVLIASVEFDGQDKSGKFQSKVLVMRSGDSGVTWSAPQKISTPGTRNQSPFFVIDPNNGSRVYAGWRVFSDNAIVGRASFDGGTTWTPSKPVTIVGNFQAYDQVGQQMPAQQQFRTNAYVTGAMDGSGALHVAVAERVDATGAAMAGGTPRIVVTSSYDGGSTWTLRRPVALTGTGPQFMPTMTIVGSPKLAGDPQTQTKRRADIFLAYYAADANDLSPTSPGPIAGSNIRFHMYLSHADSWPNTAGQINFDAAKQVSRYAMDPFNPGHVVTGAGFGVTSENRGYPIFYGGTGGFTGDYNIVVPRTPFVKTTTGAWRATTALDASAVPAPAVQIAWGDTRDVILPTSPAPAPPPPGSAPVLDGFAWYNYSPPGTGSLSACNAGSRNQNPYTAEATMGVLAAAPLTFKDPTLPRSYPLYVQNKTANDQAWRATIDAAAAASFNYPFPNTDARHTDARQVADFLLKPYSTVTGTVFVNQSYSAPFNITFQRIDSVGGTPVSAGPATSTVVTLNTSGGTDPIAATQEFHDPLLADDVLVFTHSPSEVDPYVQDDSRPNVGVLDPNQNPLGQNPPGQNPLGQNPFGQNPLGQNPLGQNVQPNDITDYTFRVKNGGTTTSAYKAVAILQQQLDQTLYKFQIIVNRVTRAPGLSRKDCSTLGNQFQPIQISSVENPLGQNPLGQNPFGQNPFGQNPLGQNPFGQNPLGQNAPVSDNQTFYVAPSSPGTSAALKKPEVHLARNAARPSGGVRFVHVSSSAEYLNTQSSSASAPDFSLNSRGTDEVWYTVRVFRTRALQSGDVAFSPDALSVAVIAEAPNVSINNGVITVSSAPAAFKAPDLVYTGALTGIPASTYPGWTLTLPDMTAKNSGNAPAVPPFRQGLYLRGSQLTGGPLLLGQGDATSGSLAVGSSVTVAGVTTLVIPRTVAPGLYDVCAVLDSTNVVTESHEDNNFNCVPLEIRQLDPVAPTFLNTDVVSAGFGGMRGIGTGSIIVPTLPTGSVIKTALLYWHGPTNSSDPTANANVTFNNTSVTGINIGVAYDNTWQFLNSQAYRADVSSLVTGGGTYSLSNFRKPNADTTLAPIAEINGASLIVFFDDGIASNNKNVYLRNVNDSNNGTGGYEPANWSQTLTGVGYVGGAADLVLHVSDGQNRFTDTDVKLNDTPVLSPNNLGQVFAGDSVPNDVTVAANYGGGLWDIKSADISGLLSPGLNTLTVTTGRLNDDLSLIVMMVVVDAVAPPVTAQSLQELPSYVSHDFSPALQRDRRENTAEIPERVRQR